MACTRNSTLIKTELIRYISSLGITVNTVTKARGNKGFFKEGRIDISKNLDDDSSIRTIVHEFAHFSNYKIDKSLKDLVLLFGEDSKQIRDELLEVTKFVDENAKAKLLIGERDRLKVSIKSLTDSLKSKYPDFSLSENFKPFRRYSRFSDIKYLEKYDRVKVTGLKTTKLYTLSNVREDFPDVSDEIVEYLNLKSQQRRRAKITRRITKLEQYYSEPCELFARFIEGLYLDNDEVKNLAPYTYGKFIERFNRNYYYGLREIFSILRVLIY